MSDYPFPRQSDSTHSVCLWQHVLPRCMSEPHHVLKHTSLYTPASGSCPCMESWKLLITLLAPHFCSVGFTDPGKSIAIGIRLLLEMVLFCSADVTVSLLKLAYLSDILLNFESVCCLFLLAVIICRRGQATGW